MLRDYAYTLDAKLILEVLDRFDANFAERMERFAMIEFRVITPDSFIWRFLIGGEVYYLYAEDFATSLDMVHTKIRAHAKPGATLEFVKASHANQYVNSALRPDVVIFEPPEDDEQMMEVAVESGHDFVFLCRSDEDPDDALFNTHS